MPKVMNALKETVNTNTFDIVFAYSIEMSLYLSNIGIPTLVDLVDAHFDEEYKLYKLESNLVNKQLHWFMYYLLKKWTKNLSNRGHTNLIVTTSREAEVLLKIIPACRLTAVNSGVDTDYFSPGETAEEFPQLYLWGQWGHQITQWLSAIFITIFTHIFEMKSPISNFILWEGAHLITLPVSHLLINP